MLPTKCLGARGRPPVAGCYSRGLFVAPRVLIAGIGGTRPFMSDIDAAGLTRACTARAPASKSQLLRPGRFNRRDLPRRRFGQFKFNASPYAALTSAPAGAAGV